MVVSRLPFENFNIHIFCGKTDCRHISAAFGERAGLRDPITVHNFYVPAGGDIPDPAANPKFAHKLAFLDEMRDCAALRPAPRERAILLGDLNVAPLEHDVWSHKQMLRVVSHTPIECEKFTGALAAGGWVDSMRRLTPEPAKLYTWWSYRAADWRAADRGRRLDHFWTSRRSPTASPASTSPRLPRRRAAVGPRAGDGDVGGLGFARCDPPSTAGQCGADILDFAGPLVGSRYDQLAQAVRGVRIVFEHFQKHGARNAAIGIPRVR